MFFLLRASGYCWVFSGCFCCRVCVSLFRVPLYTYIPLLKYNSDIYFVSKCSKRLLLLVCCITFLLFCLLPYIEEYIKSLPDFRFNPENLSHRTQGYMCVCKWDCVCVWRRLPQPVQYVAGGCRSSDTNAHSCEYVGVHVCINEKINISMDK